MSEINVSGCCHNNSNDENGMCEIYKVRCYQRHCYYKQLQQYKQLCKQKTVDNLDLIKENEELRKINKANADNYVRWRDKEKEETEKIFINGCQIYIWLLAQNKKKSQCLDEIENLLTTCENNNCKGCKYTKQCSEIDTHSWILKKIEEVKDNE